MAISLFLYSCSNSPQDALRTDGLPVWRDSQKRQRTRIFVAARGTTEDKQRCSAAEWEMVRCPRGGEMVNGKFEDGDCGYRVLGRCHLCKHKFAGKPGCKAFPDGIPYEILTAGDTAHSEPYPGDHGLRFEPQD